MKKQIARYTKIENEILEKILQMDLTASEMKVFLVFIRKINGFHKKQDRISISQIMELTGLSNRGVITAQNNLQQMNIIKQIEKGISRIRPSLWEITTDTILWRPMKRTSLVNNTALTYELFGIRPMNTTSHTKENKRKQNVIDYRNTLLGKKDLTLDEVKFLNDSKDI